MKIAKKHALVFDFRDRTCATTVSVGRSVACFIQAKSVTPNAEDHGCSKRVPKFMIEYSEKPVDPGMI